MICLGVGSKGLNEPFFPWIPGGHGDTELNNWFLERNFQLLLSGIHRPWINTVFTTNSFWPETNTLAWSDNWLILTPIYALLRLIASPVQAFSSLLALCLTANFMACYLLARHGSPKVLYRIIAALLSSFSLTIVAQIWQGHHQLIPAFAGVMAIDSLLTTLHNDPEIEINKKRKIYYPELLSTSAWLLLQLAIGFYQGAFFSMACVFIFLIWIIKAKNLNFIGPNANLRAKKKVKHWQILTTNAVLIAINAIIYRQYFIFSKQIGPRPWKEVYNMIPRAWSYGYNVLSTPQNVSLPAPVQYIDGNSFPGNFWEQSMFPGYAFYALLFISLFLWRKQAFHSSLSLIAGSLIILIAISLGIGGHDKIITAWKFIYAYIPGFSAIRAVSRIGILMTMLASPILANGLQNYESRYSKDSIFSLMAILTFLFLTGNVVRSEGSGSISSKIFEQNTSLVNSRIEKVIEGKKCSAFFVSATSESLEAMWVSQFSAMWASLKTKVPTISGYSGHQPSGGWSPTMDEAAMTNWLIHKGLPTQLVKQVCWINGSKVILKP
jgi:hypothetical protein